MQYAGFNQRETFSVFSSFPFRVQDELKHHFTTLSQHSLQLVLALDFPLLAFDLRNSEPPLMSSTRS